MNEICVHCGQPIQFVRYTPNGPAWLHHLGGHSCVDGSGHVACPVQVGIE